MGNVLELTNQLLDRFISNNRQVVIYAYGSSVRTHKLMRNVLESVSMKFISKCYFGAIDVDKNQQSLALRYRIRVNPLFVVYIHGRESSRFDGEYHKDSSLLETKITELLSLDSQQLLPLLQKLTPSVPVTLSRISELIHREKDEVERRLLDLLEENPRLGTYNSLSQDFILSSGVNEELEKLSAQFAKWEKTTKK